MYALHPSLQCIMRKAQSVLFFRSLLITYVITLSLEKEFIVFEKVWKKSRILDPKICPNLGFGALNPSLQFCIFTFISVGSIPHSYLFTSATGRIGVQTVSKYGKILSNVLRSTSEIGPAQLRSVTEIAPPQPFLCVNRSPIWYDLRGGTKAVRGSVNIALIPDSI